MKDLYKGFVIGYAVGFLFILMIMMDSRSDLKEIHKAEIKFMDDRYNKLQSRCDSAYYAERLQVIEKAFNKGAGE